MRGTEKRSRERRRRHGWKAAGFTLLGLMGGSVGCQWTGTHAGPSSANDPPTVAIVQPERSASAAATADASSRDAVAVARGEIVRAEATASNRASDSGIVQTSAQAVEKTAKREILHLEKVPPRVGADADLPPDEAKKPDKDKKDPKTKDNNEPEYQLDRKAAVPSAGMDTPAIPRAEKTYPITLGASLTLAGVENPRIALAEQAIQSSLALQLQARVLLLPNLNAGTSYHLHNGTLQSSFGAIRKVDEQSLYTGLGARTVAAETVGIPGIWMFAHLGDAIYEPLVARRVVDNRRFAATATRNQVLLDVSTRYVDLLGAEGRLAVVRQSEKDFQEVVRVASSFYKVGQGRKGNADRAEADLLSLEYNDQRYQEQVAVASAELARLLNLSPDTRLQTAGAPIQVVQFTDDKVPLSQLVQVAARNRPEVQAAAAAIEAARVRLRQEQTRPLFPLLSMGYSAGQFGGGSVASGPTFARTNPTFGNFAGRQDVDVLAVWTLQNFGFGNLALMKNRRALMNEAEANRVRVLNRVEREVADAYNLSASRLRQIEIARRRVKDALDGFERDLNRTRLGQGLPIEVLNNARLLVQARQALLEAIIGYDRVQFQLFVALGQPPTLVVEDDRAAR